MRLQPRHYARGPALAALTVAAVLGGAAYAAIPDANGVIHGCYDKQSGKLRVIDSEEGQPKACGNGETPLSWSQQGPQGVPGSEGPRGPEGPQGDTGPQGPAGVSGYLRQRAFSETNDDDLKTVTARCPGDKKVLGGGSSISSSLGAFFRGHVLSDNPTTDNDGWFVMVRESSETGTNVIWSLSVYAICADVGT